MKKRPQIALLTNVPAPYRVPMWNHLSRLTRGNLEVRFIASSDARRRTWWAVPVRAMRFGWQFLYAGEQGGLGSALAMLAFLLRHRPRAVICGGYNSLAAWITFA